MTKGIRELKKEIDKLTNTLNHPDVIKLRKRVFEERKPQIEYLKKQVEELRLKIPEKRPRFPEGVPQNVLDICDKYWRGTTEYNTYRIHFWNDKAVWTSYPSGGYSDNSGWHSSPACFYLISLTEKTDGFGKGMREYLSLHGRQSKKKLLELLKEYTK